MKKPKPNKYILLFFSLLFCYAIEWTASFFTQVSVNSWYKTLEKPFWTPPSILFPIVWTLLYTLIAVSFWKVLCNPQSYNKKTFIAFFSQMTLNFMWSFSFFFLTSPILGLLNILLLLFAILWNLYIFYSYSKLASLLLIPYLLWVSYATTLNFGIWILN